MILFFAQVAGCALAGGIVRRFGGGWPLVWAVVLVSTLVLPDTRDALAGVISGISSVIGSTVGLILPTPTPTTGGGC